jgi:hypothetical protein
MLRKTLLVLANSFKRSERCVAGRELVPAADGSLHLGPWVRPVSGHDEGELSFIERVTRNTNLEVGVGDVVEVSLDRPTNEPEQPENWLLWQNGDWMDLGRGIPRPDLDALEEFPSALWWDPGSAKSDRALDSWVARKPPAQSLYVVRAERLVIRLGRGNYGAVVGRCGFEYAGRTYDLSLTDPVVLNRLAPQAPKAGAGPIDVAVGSVRVCVSFTHAFNGYHYKVVATILEGV